MDVAKFFKGLKKKKTSVTFLSSQEETSDLVSATARILPLSPSSLKSDSRRWDGQTAPNSLSVIGSGWVACSLTATQPRRWPKSPHLSPAKSCPSTEHD